MREYAQFSASFWTGETGKALRGDKNAQILGAYLFTSTHANLVGLYFLPLQYASYETGLTLDEVRAALARLSVEGFAHYDTKCEYVWVVSMAKRQLGLADNEQDWEPLTANDNRRKPAQRAAAAARGAAFYGSFLARYGRVIGVHAVKPVSDKGPETGLQTLARGRTSVGTDRGEQNRNRTETEERQKPRVGAGDGFSGQQPANDSHSAPPVSSGAKFEVAEAFRKTYNDANVGEIPKLFGDRERAAVDHCVKIAARYGKPLPEVAAAVCLAARPGAPSWDFNVAKVDPYAAAPPGPSGRGGRMQPTRGTGAEDFADAKSEEQQLEEVRQRRARSANGT